jgi:hypothetical protein
MKYSIYALCSVLTLVAFNVFNPAVARQAIISDQRIEVIERVLIDAS